jgi:hypothetical protein
MARDKVMSNEPCERTLHCMIRAANCNGQGKEQAKESHTDSEGIAAAQASTPPALARGKAKSKAEVCVAWSHTHIRM